MICLRDNYALARSLYLRDISRSDETYAQKTPAGMFGEVIQYIQNEEMLLVSHQQSSLHEIERLNLDQALLQAVTEVNKFKFFAKMGDYWAILNQEMKSGGATSSYAFNDITLETTSMIVKAIDREQKDREINSDALTPVTDSIYNAHKFFAGFFKDAPEMIDCFRSYSTRNELFHSGVKELADECRLTGLFKCLVEDNQEIKFLDVSQEMKEHARATLQQVSKLYFLKMEWQVDGHYQPSPLAEKRIARKMKKGSKDNISKATVLKKTSSEYLSEMKKDLQEGMVIMPFRKFLLS